MQSPPTVSIVIVSWNAASYLRECLAALARNPYAGPAETFVVDNASTDGSPEMVRAEFPDVRLIRNAENLGFARANNAGIAHCTGDFIALVNSDIETAPGCIDRLVDYCRAHPGVGLVGPRILGPDGEQQPSCRRAPTLRNMACRALALDSAFPNSPILNEFAMGGWDHRSTREVDILSGCFWLARRSALSDVGLLDEGFFMYGEDMDWCRRFREAGWGVVFVPEAQAIHHGAASSSRDPVRFFVEKQVSDLKYWRKHRSRVAAAAYYAIALVHHALRAAGYGVRALVAGGARDAAVHKARRSLACLDWMLTGRRPRPAGATGAAPILQQEGVRPEAQ